MGIGNNGNGAAATRRIGYAAVTMLLLGLVLAVVFASTAPASALAETRFEQTDTRLSYSGSWSTLRASADSGGSMKYSRSSGASITVNFTGTSLTYLARTGKQYGKAWVTLDGGTAVLVDLYSSANAYRQPVWSSGTLSDGPHTVTIAYSGQKNPYATYPYVNVDAFDVTGTLSAPSSSTMTTTTLPVTTSTTVPPTTTTTTTAPGIFFARFEQTDTRLSYSGSWSTLRASADSGGSMKYSRSSGASITVNFTGTSLTYLARTGKQYGKAWVTLDGGTAVLVDLYSSANAYRQPVWSSGTLSDGPHTVTIAYSGQKNPYATYPYVNVDAFDVTGTLSAPSSSTTTTIATTTTSPSTTSTTQAPTTSTTVPTTTDLVGSLSRAASGQTVMVAPGTYTFAGTLDVPAGVTIVGHGATINGTLYLSSGSKVVGFNFPGGSRAVIIGGLSDLAIGAVVRDCTFGSYSWAALQLRLGNDCTIASNVFNGLQGVGANIQVIGGKRNQITNNVTHGGITAIAFLYFRSVNGGGRASLMEDNVVTGNTCDGFSEEGITFDVIGNGGADVASLEYDKVTAVGESSVTLSPLAFPNYVGYDIVFLSGALAGRTRSIVGQSGATFALDAPITGVSPGDEVVIGATFKRNLVSGNTVSGGWTTILLYGMAFENIIENNIAEDIEVRSVDNLDMATGSATRTYGRAPCGYNTVRNNAAADLVELEYYAWPTSPSGHGNVYAHYISVGNNVIGNTCARLGANNQICYLAGNSASLLPPLYNVTLLTSAAQ